MRITTRTLLSALLVASLVLTAPGCGAGLSATQREQCRALRGRMAGRVVGGILVSAVVLGVVVIAAAAGANGPNFGNGGGGDGGRSRRATRRAERLAVCRAPEAPGDPGVLLVVDPNGPVPGEFAPEDIPIVPVEAGPPSVAELDDAIAGYADVIRECAPTSRGTLYVDARIQGATGAVSGVVLGGDGSHGVSAACVHQALATLRVAPFEGAVDVRWGIEYAAPAQ